MGRAGLQRRRQPDGHGHSGEGGDTDLWLKRHVRRAAPHHTAASHRDAVLSPCSHASVALVHAPCRCRWLQMAFPDSNFYNIIIRCTRVGVVERSGANLYNGLHIYR